MRKFSLYFACFFTLILMGCGDKSGDPTAQISKLEAAPADVAPGGDAVITATVVKAVGKKAEATAEAAVTEPGWGENVTFKLLTANGGRLSVLTQKTDGKGEAKTVYTAGNNYSNDTIQATLDNGMSAAIVIKKTGNLTGPSISSFAASPSTVAGGQSSVITAKVTDGGSSNPVKDGGVTFTVATNESGGCLLNAANACVNSITVYTDTGGNAVTVYRAGNNDSTAVAHDTIRGSLANGSSNAAVVTRSAETPATPTTPLSIAVAASPTSVTASQVSIVTATLTGDDKVGVTVTFTLPVNNSGASLFSSTATTDGSGKAVVIYQPGTHNPTQSVSDTVRASVGSISASAAITRTGTAPLSYNLTMSANPATLVAKNGSSVITANLKDTTGTAVSGQTINFACTRGTLTGGGVVATATTDGNGNAVTTFTGDNGLTGSGTVTATWTTYTNAVIINIP